MLPCNLFDFHAMAAMRYIGGALIQSLNVKRCDLKIYNYGYLLKAKMMQDEQHINRGHCFVKYFHRSLRWLRVSNP